MERKSHAIGWQRCRFAYSAVDLADRIRMRMGSDPGPEIERPVILTPRGLNILTDLPRIGSRSRPARNGAGIHCRVICGAKQPAPCHDGSMTP